LLPLGEGEGERPEDDGLGEGLGDALEVAGVGYPVGVAGCWDWLYEVVAATGWCAEAPPTAQASSPSTARPAASANTLLRQ
jgi:hypothetical protein